MKKYLTLLLATVMLLGAQAYADNFFIIEDSDSRYLTEEELWAWDYDALGYALNEIFARYGYHFEDGGKYKRYFENQDWYVENTRFASNDEITSYYLTNIEWKNERLIKDVRADMKAKGTLNPNGMSIEDVRQRAMYGTQLRFYELLEWTPQATLNVYSGPGKGYLRGANGKAAVAMGRGAVYVAGRLDNWVLVMYWTNNGSARAGYINEDELGYKLTIPAIALESRSARITRTTRLTDDIILAATELATLSAGTQVTYLAGYGELAYIETIANGKPVRGFVNVNSLVY